MSSKTCLSWAETSLAANEEGVDEWNFEDDGDGGVLGFLDLLCRVDALFGSFSS